MKNLSRVFQKQKRKKKTRFSFITQLRIDFLLPFTCLHKQRHGYTKNLCTVLIPLYKNILNPSVCLSFFCPVLGDLLLSFIVLPCPLSGCADFFYLFLRKSILQPSHKPDIILVDRFPFILFRRWEQNKLSLVRKDAQIFYSNCSSQTQTFSCSCNECALQIFLSTILFHS